MNPTQTNPIPQQYQTPQLQSYLNSAAQNNFASTDPSGYASFKQANPNLQYTQEDQNYFTANQGNIQRVQPINTSSPTINAGNLTNVTPLQLPTIPTSTTSAGIISSVAQRSANLTAQAQQEAQQILANQPKGAETAQNSLLTSVKNLLGDRTAVANQVSSAEDLKVGEQRKVLNDINTQIADQNVGYRAETDKVRQSFGTDAQKQVEINNIENGYGRRLADLAIRQSAAQGNIAGIQADSDRRLKLLTEPIDQEINYYKDFGQKYVDSLNEKEKTQLNLQLQLRQDAKKDLTDLENARAAAISDVAKNGGGTDQATIQSIQNATDVQSIAQAAAKYTGAFDRQKEAFNQSIQRAQLGVSQGNLALARQKYSDEKSTKLGTPQQIKAQLMATKDKVGNIDTLVTSKGLAGAVGPSIFARSGGGGVDQLIGQKQNFLGSVQQLSSQLTLDSLVNAKAKGATFGALSEGELALLQASGSKLDKWAIKNSSGNVTGYNVDENTFKKELDTINALAKRDYLIKGGKPEDIGVSSTSDGSYWAYDSFGNLIQVY